MNTEKQPAERSQRAGFRRHLKLAVIGAYLIGLATVPHIATLGFSSNAAVAEEAELKRGEADRFQAISWDVLGGFDYDFEIPGMLSPSSETEIAERSLDIIPSRVRKLDGQSIALRGYVIPTKMEGDVVRSFILAAKNEVGCCFGSGLLMNQWVAVEVPKDQEFRCELFELTTVMGKLDVGEEIEDGYVMSLYRMAAQKIRK